MRESDWHSHRNQRMKVTNKIRKRKRHLFRSPWNFARNCRQIFIINKLNKGTILHFLMNTLKGLTFTETSSFSITGQWPHPGSLLAHAWFNFLLAHYAKGKHSTSTHQAPTLTKLQLLLESKLLITVNEPSCIINSTRLLDLEFKETNSPNHSLELNSHVCSQIKNPNVQIEMI